MMGQDETSLCRGKSSTAPLQAAQMGHTHHRLPQPCMRQGRDEEDLRFCADVSAGGL